MKMWSKWIKGLLIFGIIFGLVMSLNSGAFAKDTIKFGCAMSFTGKKSRTGKLYVDSFETCHGGHQQIRRDQSGRQVL